MRSTAKEARARRDLAKRVNESAERPLAKMVLHPDVATAGQRAQHLAPHREKLKQAIGAYKASPTTKNERAMKSATKAMREARSYVNISKQPELKPWP